MEQEIFSRNVPGTTEKLSRSVAGIAGCGGLGSHIAVALTRAGVGTLILADFDCVEPSNLNRQCYFRTDIGRLKTEALSDYLTNINPRVSIRTHTRALTPDSVEQVFGDSDVLLEAFDKAESKQWLIETWCTLFPGRPLVGGSGIAGLGKTSTLQVHQYGTIYLCGDGVSGVDQGLSSTRVGIVAHMQANVAAALLSGEADV